MIWNSLKNRNTGVLTLVMLGCLLVSGCYTRQIEGIQKDLDSLDRKIHTLNQKKGSETGSNQAALQLEDRVNEVTLQQKELVDSLASIRSELESTRASINSSPGGSVDSSQLRRLEERVSLNDKAMSKVQKEVATLQSSIDNLKGDVRSAISIIKENFVNDLEVSTPADTKTNDTKAPEKNKNVSSVPVKPEAAPVVAQLPEKQNDLPSLTVETPAKGNTGSDSNKTTYEVKPGDSINSIAKRFGADPAVIMERNQIKNPSSLKMGQIIVIP